MFIVQKILIFILVFCILYVLKKGLELAVAFKNDKEFDSKGGKVWLFLGLAVSYIMTIILTGFKLF